MSLSVRSFDIRQGESRQADEASVADFLASVDVERIETAYSDGAWRVLVLFRDLREKEEADQIASAVASALKTWRQKVAATTGLQPEHVLSESLLQSIARYVPTTTLELNVVLGTAAEPIAQYQNEIVAVVRDTLSELV